MCVTKDVSKPFDIATLSPPLPIPVIAVHFPIVCDCHLFETKLI